MLDYGNMCNNDKTNMKEWAPHCFRGTGEQRPNFEESRADVDLGHFIGFKILNFNIFWGFPKNEYFWGYEDLWIFLEGHHKTGLHVYLGVVSMHFRAMYRMGDISIYLYCITPSRRLRAGARQCGVSGRNAIKNKKFP